MNTLTEVREYLSSVPNINFGGCGIAALSMFRWCKDSNIKVLLVCMADDDIEEGKSNLENLIKGNSTGLYAPNHCGIVLESSVLDCNAENLQERVEIIYLVNESEMVDLINTGKGWRKKFKRNYIRDIEDNLSIDLSDIKEN